MAEKRDNFMSEGSKGDAGRQSSPTDQAASASSPSVVRDAAKNWPTSAAEFDRMFDDGEDIDHLIDWSKAKVVEPKAAAKPTKRVSIDFSAAMVGLLDDHAARRGVTRQALIKMWLADRLEAAG